MFFTFTSSVLHLLLRLSFSLSSVDANAIRNLGSAAARRVLAGPALRSYNRKEEHAGETRPGRIQITESGWKIRGNICVSLGREALSV
jgi:hypothetical protein